MLLSAIPLDSDGNAIHGLFVTWETSDRSVVWVNKGGMMTAGNVGKAYITARAGQKKRDLKVTVVAGAANSNGSQTSSPDVGRAIRTGIRPGADSVSRSGWSGRGGSVERTRLHAHRTRLVAPAMPQSGRDPDSLYTANNAVGTPLEKRRRARRCPRQQRKAQKTPAAQTFSSACRSQILQGADWM